MRTSYLLTLGAVVVLLSAFRPMHAQGRENLAHPQAPEDVLGCFYALAKTVPSTGWRLGSADEAGRARAQELHDLIGQNGELLGADTVAAVTSRCIQATMSEGSLFVRSETDPGFSEVDIPLMYHAIEEPAWVVQLVDEGGIIATWAPWQMRGVIKVNRSPHVATRRIESARFLRLDIWSIDLPEERSSTFPLSPDWWGILEEVEHKELIARLPLLRP